jgi:hypothetical protein
MLGFRNRGAAAALAAAVCTLPLSAQTLRERVSAVGDGVVRMSFAAREGVCGWGGDMRVVSRTTQSDDWESGCRRGPVRVALRLRGGEVVDLETRIGGRWRRYPGGTDLGTVSAVEAADYLMTIAETGDSEPGKEALFAAAVADSAVVWPRLERMARDPSRPDAIRRMAVFWMGEAPDDQVVGRLLDMLDSALPDAIKYNVVMALSRHGGDEATEVLQGLALDQGVERRLREQAVFWIGHMPGGTPILGALYDRLTERALRERVIYAYAQRRNDDLALENLMAIARSETDRELRGRAIFWLGTVRDPRAVQFLADLINR